MQSTKINLLGKTLSELEQVVIGLNLPSYIAKQIAHWLYNKQVTEIDQMTNLSKVVRETLNKGFQVGCSEPVKVQVSVDGTKKYLFKATNGFIEAAFIPEKDRATLCVSSQVGCKMACQYCMTGKQGFQGHLLAGDIINQVRSIPERDNLTNIVFMGMGEPFDNLDEVLNSLDIMTGSYGFAWAPKRITVSSIGVIPGMKRFLDETRCHLAISLNSPFDEERALLMPVQKKYPIKDVINEITRFHFGQQRRVSFEYIMFKGLNDTEKHVNELVRLLQGIDCRINLIRFHPVPGVTLVGSDDFTIEQFQQKLKKKGITTTLRQSRGMDIAAACGLLSTKEAGIDNN